MMRGKAMIALVVATAGLGVAAIPAAAELHSVTVVLASGVRVQTTVDVPAGGSVRQVSIPGVTGPRAQVIDNGPVSTPTPTVTPRVPAPNVTVPSTPTPDGNGAAGAPNRTVGGATGTRDTATGTTRGAGHTGNRTTQAGTIRAGKKTLQDGKGNQVVGELKKTARKQARAKDRGRAVDGAPTLDNPTFSLAMPGAAPIGVPNFFIDKFRIPPFLLSIYQAAGIQYGVRWEVLAAINEIETDYGRNLNVSSAGALGWMQFMPATWKQYGVDANRDGAKDPYNPVDAIFAAARYLRAAGGDKDVRRAIFAYNHADWYVDSVLMRARLIGGLPADFVGSLTGLTQGRFPVHAKAAYAGQVEQRDTRRRTRPGHNAAYVVQGDQHRRGIDIYARRGAPVVAVNDGRIVGIGHNKRLGRFIRLQDSYGHTSTYARLGSIPKTYPAPKPRKASRAQIAAELELPARDAKPTTAASATARSARRTRRPHRTHPRAAGGKHAAVLPPEMPAKQRLFAHPARPNALASGGRKQVARDHTTFAPSNSAPIGLEPKDFVTRKLRQGSRVVAGTMLGRIGKLSATRAPHVRFELRPAGRAAPRVDPKPILDGWKLLESTAIYRAKGKNPFFGDS